MKFPSTQTNVQRRNTPLEEKPTAETHHTFLLEQRLTKDNSFHQNQDSFHHRNHDNSVHPIILMIEVRNYIENLPEYKATFKKKEVAKHVRNRLSSKREEAEVSYHAIKAEMLHLVGAWKMPDMFSVGTENRYINPNHPHRTRYSDCVVRCRCGVPVTQQRSETKHNLDKGIDNADQHTDECLKEWRYRAWADLLERRREAIKEFLLHGHSIRSSKERLGIVKASTASDYIDTLDIDTSALKHQYRTARSLTATELLVRFKPETIAKAYGIDQRNLMKGVDKYTKYDAGDLWSIRRKL